MVLGMLVQRLHGLGEPTSTVPRIVVDATFGLYLGWVSVAACANVAATLVADGVTPSTRVAEAVAVVVLIVVVAWGLAWIAVGRLSDKPESAVVGLAAALAAVLVLGLTAQARPTQV